jgi:hypothetical protein
VLHLAEGAAYNRIEAARAARRVPSLLDALEDGSLTLTAVRLLAPHLTPENHGDVLPLARHKGKSEIERLVASLHPKPAVAPMIRKLPQTRGYVTARSAPSAAPSLVPGPPAIAQNAAPPPPPARATVTPLAPERYKVQLTISRETHDKLRRVQALVRHTIPTGDPAAIFDRALTLLLEDLERRRCAAASSPRGARPVADRSRHIPAAVRREVWQRDQGRCAFVGRHGRCSETAFLEYHHVRPHAAGGEPTAANIELRCRAHNAYEAALFFGWEGAGVVREVRSIWGSDADATCRVTAHGWDSTTDHLCGYRRSLGPVARGGASPRGAQAPSS